MPVTRLLTLLCSCLITCQSEVRKQVGSKFVRSDSVIHLLISKILWAKKLFVTLAKMRISTQKQSAADVDLVEEKQLESFAWSSNHSETSMSGLPNMANMLGRALCITRSFSTRLRPLVPVSQLLARRCIHSSRKCSFQLWSFCSVCWKCYNLYYRPFQRCKPEDELHN